MTLGEIAASAGVDLCTGCSRPFNHQVGSVEPLRVHYTERRVTWEVLHRMLKLCASAIDPTIDDGPTWRRVYLQNIRARDLASDLHKRIPARYLAFDKAFVRAGTSGLPNYIELRKQAHDWSRR